MSYRKKALLPGILGVALMISLGGEANAFCSSQGLELMRSLNGAWRGRGAVTPIGGVAERIACRVSYVMEGADVINQVLTCAGTDYKIEASSHVTCSGNLLEGTFSEKIGNNTGRVNGSISGEHLNIEADGPSFKGHFNVTFKSESNHLVSITQFDSARGRQVPVASIQLTR